MAAQLDRRIFLATTGAGLVLGIAGCGPTGTAPAKADDRLNLWVALAPDGIVTVRLNATDIGQGAQTGIAQIVADEMDADWSRLRVEMAPVTERYLVKGGNKEYYTGGSSSIADQFEMFAQAGATARALLIAAAAAHWSVAPSDLSARRSVVTHGASGRTLGYGALAAAAAAQTLPRQLARKTVQARNLIGTSVPRLDIPEKVNGTAIYGIDVKVEGMLIGTLAQCPWFGGSLAHVAPEPALAVKGVRRVVTLPNAVAVVADNFHAAKKGLDALRPQWRLPATRVASDTVLVEMLSREVGAADSGLYALNAASAPATAAGVAKALATSRHVFEARYEAPLLAHAPMEPMNATARVTADRCELWAPMQRQDDMLRDLSKALGLPRAAIVLTTTRAGGGFGRRLQTDYGVFAALVARAVGRPVKLIWTREEDFTHDFYRPASVAHLRASLRDDATIEAIDYSGATSNDTALGGFARNYPYGAVALRHKQVELPLPIGAWRSVDASITVFLIESFVDEIAHAHGLDPLAYRKRLIGDDPRALRVLDAVARLGDWGRPAPGCAQGLAWFRATGWKTLVAQIVELSVDQAKKITLRRVSCAIDPGLAVNPGQVRAQCEGGIVLGLSAALGEKITLKDGRVEQTNFDSYAVARLAAIPRIDVEILQSDLTAPGGIGEPPVPPALPALANALFRATGERVRRLPLSLAGYHV